MASIYSRIDKNNKKKYYGSIYHNGKRIRKFLGNSKELAEASLKKLEYELLFNIQNFYTKYQIPSYEKAILSFLKEVERTSVKFKQVSDIDTKLNYFKNYCFSIGISDLDAINRNHGIRRVYLTGNIFQVAMEMGHKNVTTTQYYLRLPMDMIKSDFPSLAVIIDNMANIEINMQDGNKKMGTQYSNVNKLYGSHRE